MARKTDEDRKRNAARQRAEASRIRHAASGKPPADVVDAAVSEALVRIMESQGWRTVDGISQIHMTVTVTRIIIWAMQILVREKGYNQQKSAEALTQRFRRPIRPRGADEAHDHVQAS